MSRAAGTNSGYVGEANGMKKGIAGLVLVAAMGLAGCSSGAASSACAAVENGVGVCLDGKALTWTETVRPPHMHEAGGYYGPVADLEKALGVKAEIAADKKSVTVNGTRVVATASKAMGIHEHDALLYAPIKEFAEAAGFTVEVDATKHVVSIKR